MQTHSIDINADVGEGLQNEHELLPLVSSCNIACGGHAGNETIMREVIQIAKSNNVKIGAHPSYPDRENFGRKVVEMSCAALYSTVKSQIQTMMAIMREEHLQLHHVKCHGALYNSSAKDNRTAEVVLEVMKSIKQPLKLYVPFGSVIAEKAISERIPITYEAFADRNYNEDLSLVSRDLPLAMIQDVDELIEHAYRMIVHKKVKTINGVEVPIKAQTICIHGDNPKAINMLKSLTQFLTKKGIIIH
ncbi:MAG: 5-oxoprolinase subunit PxpA [Bacteroidia bacterium]|nr:5-oxoprolinase subunit PxpA [Bacteroidia bacterium]